MQMSAVLILSRLVRVFEEKLQERNKSLQWCGLGKGWFFFVVVVVVSV